MHLLEKQVENQQTEITGLRDVVEDLRSSLQLSDAQNLALQVLLKKMAKAEVQLPVIGNVFIDTHITMCDFYNFGLIFAGQYTVCLKG